ncbi:MAG: DNA modification methylase [Anaerolineae bacterium]
MLKINDTFKKLIPPLSTDEYTALETSIVKEGVRDAIVTWQGFIIDGHNRFEIATRHGIAYKTTTKEFDSEDDVKEWMILNQFGRRNLNSYQRSVLSIPLEEIIARRAKENKVVGMNTTNLIRQEKKNATIPSTLTESLVEKPVITPIDTRKEVAKIASVSTGTIHKVKAIESKATPETKAKLSRSEMSINEAYKEIRAVEKKAEVRAIQQKEAEILSSIKVVPTFDFVHNKSILDCKDVIPDGIKLLLTDPPYGQAFISNRRVISEKDKGIANDGDLETALQLLDETLAIIYPKMQDDSFAFVFTSWRFEPQFREVFEKYFAIKNSLIWVKPNHGSGDLTGSFAPKHERILFGVKGNPKLRYRIPDVLNGSDIVTSHPTSKPIDLLQELIKVTTVENDMVIDPFSGHGSTSIACINTGRKVFATEIDSDNYGHILKNLKNAKS